MLIRAIIGILLVQLVLLQSATGQYINGRAVGVIDGDTIDIEVNGDSSRIRLYGVDAPESDQSYGPRARDFVAGLVAGEDISARVAEQDRYGRFVAEVFVNGRSINRELVRAGFAWWYEDYAEDDADLRALERSARHARRGLWRDSDPIAPWEWRRRSLERVAGDEEMDRHSMRAANSRVSIPIVNVDSNGRIDYQSLRQALFEAREASPNRILLLAHGWWNSRADAISTYSRLATSITEAAANSSLDDTVFFVGIYWPSIIGADERRGRTIAPSDGRTLEITTALPASKSPQTFLEDVMTVQALLNKPEAEADEADYRQLLDLLRRYSITPELLEDVSVFDLPAGPPDQEIFRGGGRPSLQELFQVFTFWQMKKRAGIVGGAGGRTLIDEVQQTLPDADVQLIGHSFGTKLWLSALANPRPMRRPVQSAVLLQPAVSAYAFATRVPGTQVQGGYRQVLFAENVSGSVVATYSRHDTPLHRWYPLGSWLARQTGELERAAASRYAALGAVGAEAVGALGSYTRMKPLGEPYNGDAVLVSVDASQYIADHSDIADLETAWLIWSLGSSPTDREWRRWGFRRFDQDVGSYP